MGLRILPFSLLPHGFYVVGCLGRLHEAGQVLGPLSSGFTPKGHSTHNTPFFSIKGLCPSSQGNILCFETLSIENCRLLMRICSNASVACDILMMHSMHLLKFLTCIYWGESPKSMKLPMDSSSVAQSFFLPL